MHQRSSSDWHLSGPMESTDNVHKQQSFTNYNRGPASSPLELSRCVSERDLLERSDWLPLCETAVIS